MSDKDTIILLHGLWLNGFAMGLMRRRLEHCGYTVHAYSYSSVRLTLSEIAERVGRYCNDLGARKLHLVGHSMGGLVALQTAALVPHEYRGRLVLVGTPYAGSFSGRRLAHLPGGRRLLGCSIAHWLSDECVAIPADYEVGVIAGSRGIGLGRLIAPKLPQPNDGVVSVSETHVPNMRDHIVLPVSHSQMLISREVVRQACAFLKHGVFDRASSVVAKLGV